MKLSVSLHATYHGQVDALVVLECIKQPDQPLALRIGQNVAFSEHMSDLIKLEQELLAHDLERADLARILLRREIDLSIATLTNLCEDLEVTVAQPCTTLAQIGAFPAEIDLVRPFPFRISEALRLWVLSVKLCQAVLTVVDVGKEIIVVVEKV